MHKGGARSKGTTRTSSLPYSCGSSLALLATWYRVPSRFFVGRSEKYCLDGEGGTGAAKKKW